MAGLIDYDAANPLGRPLVVRDSSRRAPAKSADELGAFFASPLATIETADEDALPAPAPTKAHVGWPEPRNWHVAQGEKLFPDGELRERRIGVALIADVEPEWPGYRLPADAWNAPPFLDDWSAKQRSTRVVDGLLPRGRTALLSQLCRVVDDAEQQYTLALLRGRKTADVHEAAAAGYVWDPDTKRCGLLDTLLAPINQQDVLATGREGTEHGIQGLQRAAHWEVTSSLHGGLVFDPALEIGGFNDGKAAPGLAYKASLAADAALANNPGQKETRKWGPWFKAVFQFNETGNPGGNRDGNPDPPANPPGTGDGGTTGGGGVVTGVPTGGQPAGGTSFFPPPASTGDYGWTWLQFVPIAGGAARLVSHVQQVAVGGVSVDGFTLPGTNTQVGVGGSPTLAFGTATSTLGYNVFTDAFETTPIALVVGSSGELGTVQLGSIGVQLRNQAGNDTTLVVGAGVVNGVVQLGTGGQRLSGDTAGSRLVTSAGLRVQGKLTVDGGIDPTYMEWSDGAAEAVAAANRSRVRWDNARGVLEASDAGAPYEALARGLGSSEGRWGGEGVRLIDPAVLTGAPHGYQVVGVGGSTAFSSALGGSEEFASAAIAGEFKGVATVNALYTLGRTARVACALGRDATVTTSVVVAGLTGVADPSAGTPDGAYFRATDGGNLVAVTRTGGAETTTDTTVGLGASAVRHLRVEAAAATVRFFVDGILRATHTTNLPASGTTHFSLVAVEATAAAARAVRVAWVTGRQRTDS